MTLFFSHDEPVLIWTGGVMLDGVLTVPREAGAFVVVAGTGGTVQRDGCRTLARRLNEAGHATLLADLLTSDEQQFDARTGHFRIDVHFLAERLQSVVKWVDRHRMIRHLPMSLFASGTVASAALVVAAQSPIFFSLTLSRPRLDMAHDAAARVTAPTLVLLDADDLGLHAARTEAARMGGPHRVDVVPGTAAMLEDENAASAVARHVSGWMCDHLPILSAEC